MIQRYPQRSTTVLLLLLAFLVGVGSSHAQEFQSDLPAVVRRAGRAVVSIRVYDAAGRQIGIGSGFVVQGGRVVTNSHVVEGAARAEIFDADGQLLGTTQFAENLSTSVDLAVLPRMGTIPGSLPLSESLASVGERVIVIGAPEGLTNTVSDGIVSAFRNTEGRRWMQITAPISSGSSGGPVLNNRGEVVGVSVAMLRQGQNLNFAIPVSDVRAMLSSPAGRVAFPSGSASPASSAASSRSADGPERISVGEVIRGTLEASDTRLEDGSFMDGYIFSARRGQKLIVRLASPDFDAYVAVHRPTGDDIETIGSDDDGGTGTNSQLIITIPQDGQYFVGAGSAGPGELGRYTLSLIPDDSRRATPTPPSRNTAGSTDRWVLADETDEFAVEVDQTRILPQGNRVYRVWVRSLYDQPSTDAGGDSFDTALVQHDYDCTRLRSRILLITQYLNSRVVYSTPAGTRPSDWYDLVPGSVDESAARMVCELARRRGI